MRPVPVVVIGCAIGLTTLLTAQEPPPPIFRSGVEIVQLDVTVLDRHRKPVEGLTAADFTVRDNGEVRPVVAFTPVTLPPPAPVSATWMTAFAPDVVTNVPTEGRLVVILLDRNMAYGRSAETARQIGITIVEQLGAGDLAAVVHTAHLNRSQNFTADRQRLLAAIRSPGLGTSYAIGAGRAIGDCQCGLCSVETLTNVARSLASAGTKQKTVFFIGSGIQTAFDTDTNEVSTVAGECTIPRDRASREMFAAAQQANVVVHTIDPADLSGPPEFLAGGASRQAVQYNPDSLRELATVTGGRAVLNTNGHTEHVAPLLEEGQAYYLLAFDAGPPLPNGRMRQVAVTVNRPDVEVRTRRGYYPAGSVPAATSAPRATGDRVAPDLAGLLPSSALPLTMALVPIADPGRADPAVGLVLGVDRKTEWSAGGRLVVRAMAIDTNGRDQGSVQQRFDASAIPDTFDVLTRLYLRPGRYEIRASVETPGGVATSGSVYGYVDVPDFRRERLSLSGVALRRSGGVTLPNEALADLLPLVPTAERTFASSDRVSGFVRLYQQAGGRPVLTTLTMALVDARDRIITEQTTAFEASRFGPARAVDYAFDLPLAHLPSDEYLLRLDARADTATATRGVRLRVR